MRINIYQIEGEKDTNRVKFSGYDETMKHGGSSLLYDVYADNAAHDGIDHDAVASASRSRRYAVGK